jgi:hypothetical protein
VTGDERAWVKFFGNARNRVSPATPVLDVLERTAAHRAGSYPAGRRPRSVGDGDRMFQARLVTEAGIGDILVFGRAVALRHVDGRDDASAEELALRPWRRRWPHLIRVRDGEFVGGTLADGVSLGELMDALGAEAFATTQRNALAGRGNVDPRQAYRQQPAVRLSHEGREWLDARLDEAFGRVGRLSASQLERLHRPGDRSSGGERSGARDAPAPSP